MGEEIQKTFVFLLLATCCVTATLKRAASEEHHEGLLHLCQVGAQGECNAAYLAIPLPSSLRGLNLG